MSLPQGKREFIRKLVAGLDNLMEITQIANQIGISPRNEIEEFIKKQFLVKNVFDRANLNPLYFGQEGMLYARLIETGDLKTFLDLILY